MDLLDTASHSDLRLALGNSNWQGLPSAHETLSLIPSMGGGDSSTPYDLEWERKEPGVRDGSESTCGMPHTDAAFPAAALPC